MGKMTPLRKKLMELYGFLKKNRKITTVCVCQRKKSVVVRKSTEIEHHVAQRREKENPLIELSVMKVQTNMANFWHLCIFCHFTFPEFNSPSVSDSPHVMISYQWQYKSVLLRVRDQLIADGYKVWMDVDDMSEYNSISGSISQCYCGFGISWSLTGIKSGWMWTTWVSITLSVAV